MSLVIDRISHEVVRKLNKFNIPFLWTPEQKKIAKALSKLEDMKDCQNQIVHVLKKTIKAPQVQAPSFQKEEAEWVGKLIKTNEDLAFLFQKVGELKQKRNELVHDVAQRNIAFPQAEPLEKRHGFKLDADPTYRAGILFETIKEKCFWERKELTLLAQEHKENKLIQDVSTILDARIQQKGLLEMQTAFLRGEILQLLGLLK